MRQLSEEAQERYCVFKSVELLYLLCTEAEEADGAPSGTGCPVSHNLLEIKAYIQAHLSEKLTIDLLCKQFSVSPTFLKEGFRRAYGVPIHTYLIRPAPAAGAGADLHHPDAHPADRAVCGI